MHWRNWLRSSRLCRRLYRCRQWPRHCLFRRASDWRRGSILHGARRGWIQLKRSEQRP